VPTPKQFNPEVRGRGDSFFADSVKEFVDSKEIAGEKMDFRRGLLVKGEVAHCVLERPEVLRARLEV